MNKKVQNRDNGREAYGKRNEHILLGVLNNNNKPEECNNLRDITHKSDLVESMNIEDKSVGGRRRLDARLDAGLARNAGTNPQLETRNNQLTRSQRRKRIEIPAALVRLVRPVRVEPLERCET
jgi:hypothetical protein